MTKARIFAGSLLAVAAVTPAAALAQAGDAVKGKVVFARCALCHDVKPGPKKMGPALNGLFAAKAVFAAH